LTREGKTSSSQVNGARLYELNCQGCHGANGRGEKIRVKVPTIPDFTNMAWQLSHNEQALTRTIQNGNPPLMPAYREKLAHKEVLALAFYLRSFPSSANQHVAGEHAEPKTNQTPSTATDMAARTRRVAGLFGQYCVNCHGRDGKGTEMKAALPTIPDFTNRSWQEGLNNESLVVSNLQGKGRHMPAFQEKIGADQARSLVAYVLAFAGIPSAAPADSDLEKRFEELQIHLRELQKQTRELSAR
jgi:cytochrome c oxidase cbb3-type subunit 3